MTETPRPTFPVSPGARRIEGVVGDISISMFLNGPTADDDSIDYMLHHATQSRVNDDCSSTHRGLNITVELGSSAAYLEYIAERQSCTDDWIDHQFRNVTYRFSPSLNVYVSTAGPRLQGIIDVKAMQSTWFVGSTYPSRTIFHLTVLDCISLCGIENQILVFHGALLACGNRSVALLGSSGSGKSTLSFLLHRDFRPHVRFSSDDTFIVDSDFRAWPVRSGFGISVSAFETFFRAKLDELQVLEKRNSKVYLKSLPGACEHPLPLVAAVALRNRRMDRDRSAERKTPNYFIRNIETASNTAFLIDQQAHVSSRLMAAKVSLFKALGERLQCSMIEYNGYCPPLVLYRTVASLLDDRDAAG